MTLVEWDVKVPPSKMANSPGIPRHSLTLPHERGLPNGLKTIKHEGKDDRKGRAGPGRQTTLKWFPQEFFLSVEHASFLSFPTHLWSHLHLWSCSKPCRARDSFLLLWGNFFFKKGKRVKWRNRAPKVKRGNHRNLLENTEWIFLKSTKLHHQKISQVSGENVTAFYLLASASQLCAFKAFFFMILWMQLSNMVSPISSRANI